MPEPVPAPTVAEMEVFSEITFIPSESVLAVVSAPTTQDVSDQKWALTLADINTWSDIGTKSTKLKKLGTMEFFEGKAEESRLEFRNKVRRRYGYPPLTEEGVSASGEYLLSEPTTTTSSCPSIC